MKEVLHAFECECLECSKKWVYVQALINLGVDMNYPCIICDNGDPYSNIICDECGEHQDWLKELFESMERLVRINNNISGDVPHELSNKIENEVHKLFDELYNLKIEK